MTQSSSWLVEPLHTAVKLAASAGLLAVLSLLIFVAHPRRWWMNRAFDVEGFIEDDLCPRLRAAVSTLKTALADDSTSLPAARITVSSDSVVKVEPIQGVTAKTLSLGDFLLTLMPSLSEAGDPEDFEADVLGKRVIDLADPESVKRANASEPVARVIAEAGGITGTPVADRVLAGQMPLCLTLDKAGLAALRAGNPSPDLRKVISDAPDDDAGAALLLACMNAGSDDEAWRVLRSGLDPLLAVAHAVAELRHAYAAVMPQLRRMRMDRRPDMDLVTVFRTFNRPYLQEFYKNYNASIAEFESTSGFLWDEAAKLVDSVKANLKSNLDGKQHASDVPPQTESFTQSGPEAKGDEPMFAPYVRSTIFGVHVDENGREVLVEEMSIGSFFKSIINVFKLLPKILNAIGDMIDGILLMFFALLDVFTELRKGVLAFVVRLLLVLINCVLYVLLLLFAPWLTYVVWLATAVLPLLVKLAFFASVLGTASVLNLMMAFADTATDGAVRHLALSEDHPEAWFRTSSAHAGNGTGRFFGTLYPCCDGYAPGMLPPYCAKVSRCVPLSSPAAMLMNQLRNGRLTSMVSATSLFAHPYFPSDDVSCTRLAQRYRKQCDAPVVVNGFTVPDDVVQDLALAACMARSSQGDVAIVCELCHGAVKGKHKDAVSASATAFVSATASKTRSRLSGSTMAAVTVFAAVALAATAKVVAATS